MGYSHTVETRVKMSNAKMGDKNPRWNGGTSEYVNHAILNKVRLKVLKNAKGRCEICGERANIIHHIDDSNDNHDVENLVVVCRKCHKVLHRKEDVFPQGNTKYVRKYGMKVKDLANYFNVLPHQIYKWNATTQGQEKRGRHLVPDLQLL